jgi:coenzyme F420 biosynthesis associated uncharacterized protein
MIWRLARLGLVVSGLAAAIWVANNRLKNVSPRLIDWDKARQIALRLARRDMLIVDWSFDYHGLVAESQQAIASYVGESLPRSLDTVFVYDRVEWLDTNINNFRWLLEPVEKLNEKSMASGAFGSRLTTAASQAVLTRQMGILLGYLAQRVLGQYDLTILGKGPVGPARLYFVEPNIVLAQQQLKVDGYQFRRWIALHETTHAFEFESHPWLREHINHLLERYFDSLGNQVAASQADGGGLFGRFLAGITNSRTLLEVLMGTEQRELFRNLQATMCLVEGYSNHVMNAVGEHVLPDYRRIEQRFSQRQQRRSLAESLFSKITGLDMKRQQYLLGQRFVDEVVKLKGISFVNLAWESAANLPALEEISSPERWIARMEEAGGALR